MIEPATEVTLGIVGGTGVGASARLYAEVAARLRVATGSFPRIVLWNAPFSREVERPFLDGTPDSNEIMAAEWLVEQGVDRVLAAGATVVAMPCNTLQQTAARESARRGVPFVDMVAATLDAVRASGYRTAVLLATEATRAVGLYEGHGVDLVRPPAALGREVAAFIARAIDGCPPDAAELGDLVQRARRPGASVVLGCTDLCGVLEREAAFAPDVVDSLECLAHRCVDHLVGAGAPA